MKSTLIIYSTTDGQTLEICNKIFSKLNVSESSEITHISKAEGLDLIEISPNANPPVCKIMDMGKYKYDLQKKANVAKKKQKIVSLKEIKLRPGTDTHDYNFNVHLKII